MVGNSPKDPCYLECGGIMYPAFKKDGYSILRCSRCYLFTLQTNSINYDEFLKNYYNEGYFSGKDDTYGYADYLQEEAMVKRNMRGYLNTIVKMKPSGSFLDVGCAAGFLLELAKKQGYSVSGVDTSSYIVEKARPEIRPYIQCAALHKANIEENSQDVITMFDLIEHLSDPRVDLENVSKWLKSDGILVIGTGDVDSLYSRILGLHNHFFAPPHHLFFFSRRTITRLLSQVGLEVVSITAKGKWLTIPYIARVAKHFQFPLLDKFLNSRFIQKLFNNMWIYLFFGDNMLVIARKKPSE